MADVISVPNRASLAAADPASPAYLAESGREGIFVFTAGNLTSQVSGDPQQGFYVSPASSPSGAAGAWVRRPATPGVAHASWWGVAVGSGVNHEVGINTALSSPAVTSLLLPAGTILIDGAIFVPGGKTLQGAGKDVTLVKLRNGLQPSVPFDQRTVIRSTAGAIAPTIRNLSVDGNKSPGKTNSIWMADGTRNFVVENVAAYNTSGYAFWAHAGAQPAVRTDGIFRNVSSFNANVHFECTRVDGVLWDGMVSGDGDGDISTEAVWHPLAGSRNITYKDGRHIGKGHPFLVVGDEAGGQVDNIRYVRCDAYCTDDKYSIFISKINGTVGRIFMEDCNIVSGLQGGIPARVATGRVEMTRVRIESKTGENLSAINDGEIIARDVRLKAVTSANTIVTMIFGKIRFLGGSMEVLNGTISPSGGVGGYISTDTLITPLVFSPIAGQNVRYIVPSDFTVPSARYYIGYNSPIADFRVNSAAVARYRIRLRGLLRKITTAGSLAVAVDAGGTTNAFGFIQIQNADGTFSRLNLGNGGGALQNIPANVGDTRTIEVDFTYNGANAELSVLIGDNGVTLLAGAEMNAERF
ncbi:hypothetical protein [Sphingosinicella sp. BN140058]|uniref:hypothetical protein n=1 Tax=Sphingosinicella sp. BN140058 TaxID=1892855 RepID=UPI0010131C90|nr:hypothetical protein [Sphingosinicella sp. BN140058]QAY77051.1 hypothetical protein ETR14_11500 [Sphingosinicella sp. BN140058]